jgi:hypothetical protein
MSKVAFRQADMERIIRAAGREGAAVQIDMRTLTLTVLPGAASLIAIDSSRNQTPNFPPGHFAPDGEDNFDED